MADGKINEPVPGVDGNSEASENKLLTLEEMFAEIGKGVNGNWKTKEEAVKAVDSWLLAKEQKEKDSLLAGNSPLQSRVIKPDSEDGRRLQKTMDPIRRECVEAINKAYRIE